MNRTDSGCTRHEFGSARGSAMPLLVLVIAAAMTIMGTATLRTTSSSILASGAQKARTSAMYVAEAGAERAAAWLKTASAADVATVINGGGTLYTGESFGEGAYSVSLSAAPEVAPCEAATSTFAINADGVKAQKVVNVTFKALGSAITYGSGGPEVDVRIAASINGGLTWANLFGGNDIDGGETQTISNVAKDAQILLKATGTYDSQFSATYASDDRSGHVILLKNGDPTPSYDAYDNQASLQSFLKPILTAQKTIAVGTDDVVMLCELGSSLFTSSADFQDAVVLVTLTDASGSQTSTCTGTTYRVQSLGTLTGGASSTVESYVVWSPASSVAAVARTALVMAAGKVSTNGGLIINGCEHTAAGAYLSPGIKAVVTRSTFSRGGNSSIGGTADDGTTYGTPSKTASVVSKLAKASVTTWAAPASPDAVLSLPEGTLRALAMGGTNGSQYATDPSTLVFPLKGVTWVQLADLAVWNSVHFGSSSGILVVRSPNGTARIKNLNTGSFAGIIIADEVQNVHTKIVGQMWILGATPKQATTHLGNGNGQILYSSAAINTALGLTTGDGSASVRFLSWNER